MTKCHNKFCKYDILSNVEKSNLIYYTYKKIKI